MDLCCRISPALAQELDTIGSSNFLVPSCDALGLKSLHFVACLTTSTLTHFRFISATPNLFPEYPQSFMNIQKPNQEVRAKLRARNLCARLEKLG